MSLKVTPLGDRVLVKRDESAQMSDGGIYLPETAKEEPQYGQVMAAGPGYRLDNGDNRPLTLKNGDKVVFGKYAGTKIMVDNAEYLFMREEDVLGIVG